MEMHLNDRLKALMAKYADAKHPSPLRKARERLEQDLSDSEKEALRNIIIDAAEAYLLEEITKAIAAENCAIAEADSLAEDEARLAKLDAQMDAFLDPHPTPKAKGGPSSDIQPKRW